MHFQKSTQFLMLQTFQISFFYVKIGQWYFLNFLILGRLLHKIHQRRTQKVLQDRKRKKEREREEQDSWNAKTSSHSDVIDLYCKQNFEENQSLKWFSL